MSSVGAVQLIASVLKSPVALVEDIEARRSLGVDGPRLLLLLVAAGAVFGAVAGGYRGGPQVALAAIKLPFLLLIPTLLVLPALRGLWAMCEVELEYSRVALAGLVGATRTAMLAAAAGPLLWLAYGVDPGYHTVVLLFAGLLVAAGLPGLLVVARAVPTGGRGRWMAATASVALLGVATMQTGWLLRPFVLRPKTEDVTFLRPIEQDIFSALETTALSSLEIYDEPPPPAPESYEAWSSGR